MAYLTATYTSGRPYLGHWYNTPKAMEKRESVSAFFSRGLVPEDLQNCGFLVITRRYANVLMADERFDHVFSVDGLSIFSRSLSKNPG